MDHAFWWSNRARRKTRIVTPQVLVNSSAINVMSISFRVSMMIKWPDFLSP